MYSGDGVLHMTSLIRVTSCFRRCLYRGWDICNPLINTSVETSSLQLRTWRAGFESNRCTTWVCHPVLFWRWGGGGYFSWLPGRRRIGWGTIRLSPWNYKANVTIENKTNQRLHLSDRMEWSDTRADRYGNRSLSCLENAWCAGLDRWL